MTTQSPQNHRPSAFPRLRWLAFWLLVVIVLTFLLADWQGRNAWKEYAAEAKAKGDPLDAASVIPPPVSDAENFAMSPLFQPLFDYTLSNDGDSPPIWRNPAAKEVLDRVTLKDVGKPAPPRYGIWPANHFVDLAKWQVDFRSRSDFPKSPKAQTAAEDVLLALTKFDKEFAELREASARPKARFPVRYDASGAFTFTPHLVFLESLSQILNLRAAAELSLDRPAAAIDDLLLILRLSDSISQEPIFLSQLSSQLCLERALESIWEGLVRQQWTEDQLALLDSRLAPLNFAVNCRLSLRGGRNLFAFRFIDTLGRNPGKYALDTYSGEIGRPVLKVLATFGAEGGLIAANKVSLGHLYDRFSACVDPGKCRFFPDRCQRVESEYDSAIEAGLPRLGSLIVGPWAYVGCSGELSLCARIQESANLIRVAIALERHRLRHGAYPETLADIDPAAKSGGLPLDVVSGHPAHYARKADGRFTLYYEGWNGIDDGGKANWAGGDWVWPWPEP